MKALKKYFANKVYFNIVDEPVPLVTKDTDVKIRIDAIGICASDVHVLQGAMQMPDGNTVGHEFSGTVVEVGRAVKKVIPGDKVICELAKGACMECKLCLSGHYELCLEKTPPGWVSQGVYTEYTIQPEFCIHKIPNSLSMEVASMAEPFAVCIYGCIERGRIQKNDFTVIYGMGSIGLFTLISLIDFGVRNIVCVEKNKNRYRLAEELGATLVLLPEDEIYEKVKQMNDGWGADCVIDCSGAPEAINQGISMLRKGGKFIAIGLSSEAQIPIIYNKAVLGVIEMVFSATSSHDSWVKTIGVLERNENKVKKVITHIYTLDDWQLAYEKLSTREAVKAVLINKKDKI